jgi:type II secretory pathway pseudopilin PulG
MKKLNKTRNSAPSKHSGFTIIEIIIILGILGFIAMLNMQQTKIDKESDDARFIGQQMTIYNNAVRSHLSANLSNQDYIDDVTTTHNGVNWLKNTDQCGGESEMYILPCEFPETIGKTNLTYTTTISANLGSGKLRAVTTVDVKTPDGSSTVISSTQLGLAMLTANGGRNIDALALQESDTTMQTDALGNVSTNIILTNTDAQFFYCPFGLNVALLSPECTKDGVILEDGLLVMISSSFGANDSLLRTDGSNTMENSLRLEAVDALERKIVGTSAIYNITGEILKIGNSGVYFDDGWIPIIGDGLVIDTDTLISGNTFIKGNFDISGDILANSNFATEGSILVKGEIITESDSGISGNLFVLGDANYNNDVTVFGTLDAAAISSQTFIESNEISALNNIHSNTIVNAPIVRAYSALFSDGGAITSGDSITAGDSYVGGVRAVSGTIATASDLIAEDGTSYLGNVFASAIFDPDGDFLIDPSDISRTNITRAEKIAPSTSGGNLAINSNRVLLAREDMSCIAATEDCATKVSGYVDMEKVKIKSPGTGNWIGFVDYLNGLETYVGDQTIQVENIAEVSTIELPNDISGYSCNGSTMGVKLPQSEALAAERNYGWSCTRYSEYVYEGQTAYICRLDCSAPSAPSGSICESPGYLSQNVTVNGSTNIPSSWSCSNQGSSAGVSVYECSVPCRLPDPPCAEPSYLEDKGWYSECITPPEESTTGPNRPNRPNRPENGTIRP